MTGDVIWCHGNDYPVLLKPCLGLTLFFVCVRQESRCYAMEYQPLWLRRLLQPHLVTDPSVQKTTSTTSTLWACCLSPYASDVPDIKTILFNAKHPIWSLSSPHQVFNVASLPISESSGMKSDESGFSESMHLSYTSAKTQSYSTASTQTPPELNLPEDDLQIGKIWPTD